VAIRRWIFLLASVGMIAVLASCGASTLNVQNPPAPAASAVSIVFQPEPTGSLNLASQTPITAVVSNDSSNAGVDWSLLCQNSGNCGTLSPLHTPSDSAATYTPPSTISGNSQTVTIEAFATADHSKNVTTPITITGFASSLKGTYVFQTKGSDANGPFELAGVIRMDGNGGITSGEQTHSDPLLSVSDPITGGAYYIGPDGRGTLTLNTADLNIGQQGIENLSLVVLSNTQALLATLDNSNLQSSIETSSGTLDLQTSKTAPTGGYAFAVSGTDLNIEPMAMGGVMNIDSPNTISGAGSVADQDDAGAVIPNATLSGTLTNPDAFGSVKLNLIAGFSSTPLQFTGYIIDGMHIKLIESDNNGSGMGFGATAGVAISQGASAGTFTSNQSFSGNYVFDITGEDLTGLPASLASVGEFSGDATGNLNNGYNDEFLSGFVIGISDSFTGTYLMDPSGTGRVDSSITFTNNGAGPELIFYLTGNGNPPLVLDADANLGSVGVGLANPQAQPPFAFNGRYGLKFTQGNGVTENDATGQITVNETGESLKGFIDTNLSLFPQPNTSLTGTFVALSSSGRSTGTLTNTFFPTPGSVPNTIAVAYYLIDPGHGFFIETDSSITGELTFGYFAMRTPVCSTCP
jgi:hypothetical protein